MARGALAENGVVIAVTEAAAGLTDDYGASGITFVPDEDAQVGDLWDGAKFTYNWAPEAVTALQARLALNAAGLRATIDQAVAAADQTTRDHWEYGTLVHRDSQVLLAMQQSLGLSDTQINDLFRAAAKL